MLISLFNGLKGAINITNVFDPASIEETNRRQEEERKEKDENSALSGMLDVMLGEDAHTVQREMDESHEQVKTKESNENAEQEKSKGKSALSSMLDVALGEDAHTVQKEMDESQEQEKTKESNEQNASIKGNLLMALRQSGAQRIDMDDDYQQNIQQAWEYNQGR